MSTRTEHDSLGSFAVPSEALYGIHTARALDNFPLSGQACAPGLVRGMALVKRACAETNAQLGYLAPAVAGAIADACAELADGHHRDAIVVDALQGGAGTSLNMNLNEVIANLAEERLGGKRGDYRQVHPIDHVNLHQSTNDVFPTALKLGAIEGLRQLETTVAALQSALQDKEREFAKVLKVGPDAIAGRLSDHARRRILGLGRGLRPRPLAHLQVRRTPARDQSRRHRHRQPASRHRATTSSRSANACARSPDSGSRAPRI